MAIQQTETTSNAVRTETSAILLIETGKLQSVSAHVTNAGPEPAQVWCVLVLLADFTRIDTICAVLNQGYIGGNAMLGWTGEITCQPNMGVAVLVWSSVSAIVRVSAMTDKGPAQFREVRS